MINVVFSLDYEIYGNGTGNLKEFVYDPGTQLLDVFRRWNARFVSFVEAAEFELIERHGTDRDIELVKRQIREFEKDGFEVALHLHPQWYNARYEGGQWVLDYSEYNLCTLPRERIVEIVDRAFEYLSYVLGRRFTPISFRAGNWLFQPTRVAAEVLNQKGIKLDSSVFKGGVQHSHNLDYRPALANGYFWRFVDDANVSNATGPWLEVPIYSEMVPFWRMVTAKRVSLQSRRAEGTAPTHPGFSRRRDFLRLRYPLKFDFCRMTLDELTSMLGRVMEEDRRDPETLRPVVAIGHTKDLTDVKTVDNFLGFLHTNRVAVSTFEDLYPRLSAQCERTAALT
jgi:hypothetical protein